MKRAISWIAALCLLFAVTGCGKSASPEAEACVRAYFDAFSQADFAALDQTLDMKEHFYVEEKTEETDRIMRAIGKKITYQVISSAPAGEDAAEVVVDLTMPELGGVIDQFVNDYISVLMKNALNGESAQTEEEMRPVLLAMLCDRIAESETKTEKITIPLERKNGAWRMKTDDQLLDQLTGGAVSTLRDVHDTAMGK